MYTYANWCLSNNVGDLLTPYIIEKLSNTKCIYSLPDSEQTKYMLVGSILNWDIKNSIVWGLGISNINDIIPKKDIRSVRGHISRHRMCECGIDCSNISIGDPALLMPTLYNPVIQKQYDVAILPHYVDLEHVTKHFSHIKIINPLNTVENVINEILSCDSIISSSLHGLILAEVYGVKTSWVKISDNIGGDGTKYRDHYSALNINDPQCINLSTIHDITSITCTHKPIPTNLIPDMLATCPFKVI